jgi:acyl-CoA oxidase
MGLNGVDNGRLWFNGVRVPRDNLLNKYGDVAPDGQYSTHIPNKGKRFNTMLDALVGGRICVGSSALNVSKLGLTIAVRYACTRRQFGLPKQPEFLLMDYLSHQRRLLPLLATTYALRIGMNHTKDVLRDIQKGLVAGSLSEEDEEVKKRELFLLAGGFKAVSTWHRSETLQICRECCGGQGFAAENRIGMFKSDAEIDLTYEGDNTILMQAVAKALLQEFYSSLTGKQRLTNMLGYLKGQLGILVRSKNPMMRRYAAEAHLLDFDFYNDAFVWRYALAILTTRANLELFHH